MLTISGWALCYALSLSGKPCFQRWGEDSKRSGQVLHCEQVCSQQNSISARKMQNIFVSEPYIFQIKSAKVENCSVCVYSF